MIERKTIHTLPIHSLADLQAFGMEIANSQMFGSLNPHQGTMVASILFQKNLTVDDFARQYDFVSGKLSMKAHAMLARFNALGGEHQIEEYTAEKVSILFSYKKTSDMRFSLTMTEVMDAGICMGNKGMKDTWRKHPRSMLFARVVSEACRVLCPAASSGIYTPEEVSDFTRDDVPLDDYESYAQPAQSYTPSYTAPTPTPAIDPSVCPFECSYKGQKWESLPTDMLETAYDYPQTAQECRDYIRKILDARKAVSDDPENLAQ